MKIISFNFDNSIEAQKLITSCQKYNYNLEFVGMGHGFKNFRQTKIDLISEEIAKQEDEYICYTDGLDSWFLKSNLFQVYMKYFKDEIVISGNRDHYPATDLYKEYNFPQDTSMKYICSSQFIGPKKKLLELFEVMKTCYLGFTDQEGWNLLYTNKLYPITIDTKCRLFLNMTQVTAEELTPNFIFKETNIKPCSIHFGGPKGDDPNAKMMQQFYEKWLLL